MLPERLGTTIDQPRVNYPVEYDSTNLELLFQNDLTSLMPLESSRIDTLFIQIDKGRKAQAQLSNRFKPDNYELIIQEGLLARNIIVAHGLWMLPNQARTAQLFGENYGILVGKRDLVQEGVLGLYNAVDQYDVERGPFYPWSTQVTFKAMWRYIFNSEHQGVSSYAARKLIKFLKENPTVDLARVSLEEIT